MATYSSKLFVYLVNYHIPLGPLPMAQSVSQMQLLAWSTSLNNNRTTPPSSRIALRQASLAVDAAGQLWVAGEVFSNVLTFFILNTSLKVSHLRWLP